MHGLPPHALIESNLWIVEKFARKYGPSAPQADLRSAGALGLCEAAQRFAPSMGVAFSTYAWNWVKGHVLTELRCAHVVPVPDHTARAARREGQALSRVCSFVSPDVLDPDDAEQEDESDRAMRRRALALALETLECPDQRRAVELTFAGRAVEQVAKAMGISQRAVRDLLEAAQSMLAEQWQFYEGDWNDWGDWQVDD